MTTGDLLARLRAAIKEPHTSIHRLNISRVPLCLPPHTDRPDLYLLGLSRYAELFYGIEEAWLSLIGDPLDWISQDTHIANVNLHTEVSSPENDLSPPEDTNPRIQTVLRTLYIPELLRTKTLQDDLRLLNASCPPATQILIQPPKHQETNTGQRIKHELRNRIQDKPHILVAYVWIMYSALLYGGRDIRAILLKAGPEFWGLSVAEINPQRRIPCPLSFWHINDEAEVKGKFRAGMTDVERLLSATEQQDILDEAGRIFGILEILTRSLDDDVKVLNARV
ncbi:uncharacterized protein N7496_009536 [Penicillium cataractarum]|uniref:Heme-binding peroxidase n=1 Tax=Penicillium cataractarum TaxID=2100454 RepID=A0A9W9RU07_9EURO|nr:uncharacterized protein N7496_009536 [Penicillium cataractarum]KAJ5363823.1 hypothetical protein N7496_009536 [Penicillium cataractarum]